MSGIYIKGIKMPESCNNCICAVGYDIPIRCDAVPAIPKLVAEFNEAVKNGVRAEWCPLIIVSDHGRLIDADALGIRDIEKQEYEIYLREKGEDFLDELLLEYLRGRSDGISHASGLVRFAPTIIPADKEG